MNYNYYLLTITTRGREYTTPSELLSHYNKLKKSCKLTEFSDLRVMEKSSRLHLHTIVVSQKKFPAMLKNKTSRVFSHFQEFHHSDYNKIRDYILKQVPNRNVQNEILSMNLLENENCFDNKKFQTTLLYNCHPIKV